MFIGIIAEADQYLKFSIFETWDEIVDRVESIMSQRQMENKGVVDFLQEIEEIETLFEIFIFLTQVLQVILLPCPLPTIFKTLFNLSMGKVAS